MDYREKMQQGLTDYHNFCRLAEGKPYDEIPNIVNDNNLSYGMFEFGDDETEQGLVDINYKSILVTVFNSDGKIGVMSQCEVYGDDEQPIVAHFD